MTSWINEEEEHYAPMSTMEKLILEHMEVMREQFTKQRGALKRMSAKLTEMMDETTTCYDLQLIVLTNTQEKPQADGRIEPRQEIDSFGSKKGKSEYPESRLRRNFELLVSKDCYSGGYPAAEVGILLQRDRLDGRRSAVVVGRVNCLVNHGEALAATASPL
ncbi:hypothetical protein HAX54_047062 [Datura stramonium]|uniref:Uncharacterized protein n=1 Tax=Datura stramonium TaxID=4076 RepID=A0ABS8WHT3_DATST|nr:hypothetical protein [Datura stramonium]